MPNWKLVITSGSDAALNSLNVKTFVSASSFNGSFTGSLNGTASQAISSSYALTASYALFAANGGGGGISAIYIANAGITQGTASYFDFTGAGVTATVSNNTASINVTGGGGGGTNSGQTTNFTQSVAATTWTFVHNLNTRTPLVQVYDTSYNQIVPQYISSSNANTILINFGIATAGYAVASTGGTIMVTGSNVILNQTTPATTWSFQHNLNYQYPVFQIYGLTDEVIIPQRIVATDLTSSLIYFPSPVSGKAVATIGGFSGSSGAGVGFPFSGSAVITGSFLVSQSFVDFSKASYVTGSFTGSLYGSASFATSASYAYTASSAINSYTLNGTGSVGFATTASFNEVSSSQQQISASYIALSASYNVFSGSASTRITTNSASIQTISSSLLQVSSSTQQVSASYIALSASYNVSSASLSTRVTANSASISSLNTVSGSFAVLAANQTFSGKNTFTNDITASNITITGTASIQYLDVVFQSSSIIYASGSNQLGDASNDTQTLWGTVNVISGPLVVTGSANFKETITGSITSATNATTASFALRGNGAFTGSFSGSISASFSGSGVGIYGIVSASYAYTASSAISSSFSTFAHSASFAPGFSVSMSQATPALTWSFTHNLNSRNPVVQVYDTTYAQIIPNQIVGMNNSTAEIRFDYAQAGYAVFSNGGGLYVTGSTSTLVQTVGAATWSFTHNLNNKYNTYEVYDDNDYILIPSAIKALTNNTAELYFSGLQTGRAVAQFSGINGAPNATTASYAVTATSASYAATASYLNPITNSYVVLTQVSQSLNYVDDVAAAAGGVPLGGIYRNGNFILIRLS